MRFLITGANGFIGKRLCETLIAAGYDVRRAVRQHDGIQNTIKLSDSSCFEELVNATIDIDCVIHLAATKNRIKNKKLINDKNIVHEEDLYFTMRLAYAAKISGVRRFIFASTLKIDENDKVFTTKEVVQRRMNYVMSKYIVENELRLFDNSAGLEIVSLRFPVVYGPNVGGGFLLFMKLISLNLGLLSPQISFKRSIIFIDNLVSALITCATHIKDTRGTFTVADSEETNFSELLLMTADELNKEVFIFKIPNCIYKLFIMILKSSDKFDFITNDNFTDSQNFKNHLGWTPLYTLNEGIKTTVDWYLNGRKNK